MRRPTIHALLLAVVATCALSPAGASADWSAPERVSPGPLVSQPTLAFTRTGTAVSTWYMLQGEFSHNPGSEYASTLATRTAGGWRTSTFRDPFTPALVDSSPARGLLLFGTSWAWNGYDVDEPSNIDAVAGHLDGSGAPVLPADLGTVWSGGPTAAVADVNERGDGSIAWLGRHRELDGVYVATWNAGSRPGRARRLATIEHQEGARVAIDVNERGDTVVAWRDGPGIYTRLARRGKQFAKAAAAGSAGGDTGSVAGAALGATDKIDVVWTRTLGPQSAMVTSRSVDQRHFGRSRIVDQCTAACYPTLSATGRDGELFLAWTNMDGNTPVVRAATLRAGALRVQEVGRGDDMPWSLALDADRRGRVAIAWATPYPAASSVVVIRADSGGDYLPAELVPVAGDRAGPVDVAVDPTSGQPAFVYKTLPQRYEDGAVYFSERR